MNEGIIGWWGEGRGYGKLISRDGDSVVQNRIMDGDECLVDYKACLEMETLIYIE